eukprot:sb/3478625/
MINTHCGAQLLSDSISHYHLKSLWLGMLVRYFTILQKVRTLNRRVTLVTRVDYANFNFVNYWLTPEDSFCLGYHSKCFDYHNNCFGYHSNLPSYLSNQF